MEGLDFTLTHVGKYTADGKITLANSNGVEFDFIEVAGIAHMGSFYAVLRPVDLSLFKGMDEDSAIVFKVTRDKNGKEDKFELELDDNIINAVNEKYLKLVEEQNEGE